MSARKLRVAVGDAREGMVLARAVTSASGVVLVAEGTTLTQGLIATLERKGITHLDVYGDDAPSWSEQDLERMKESLRDEVAARFRGAPTGTVMEMMFDAALAIEAKRRLGSGKDR